jgi:hypothetical protein
MVNIDYQNLNLANKPKKRILIFLAPIILILLYVLPYLVLHTDTSIVIHDNLDSNIPKFKVLAESGKIFGSINETLPTIMNGIPRSAMGSEFNLQLWLNYYFTPFNAYLINQLLMRIFAFLGMYLLLSRYFIVKGDRLISIGVATTFSLLPFYPAGGLSIAGLPIVLFAFINIRKNVSKWNDWFILLMIPIYSSFVFSFIFFLFFMVLFWFHDIIVNKNINLKFISAIIFMTSVFLLVEHRLIYSMFLNSVLSNRLEMVTGSGESLSIIKSILKSGHHFIFGQYHSLSLQTLIIIPVVVFAIFIKIKNKELIKHPDFLYLLMIIIGISIFYGFWRWLLNVWPLMYLTRFTIFNTFHFTKVQWLHPLFWYLIFAISIEIIIYNKEIIKNIYKYFLNRKAFSLILLFMLFGFPALLLFSNNYDNIPTIIKQYIPSLQLIVVLYLISFILILLLSLYYNSIFNYLKNKKIKYKSPRLIIYGLIILQTIYNFSFHEAYMERKNLTWKEYYSENIFIDIEKFIDKPKESYRVVSIGLNPAIPLYNGFYVLDGYFTDYPLKYKQQFRKVMEQELNKNEVNRRYFDEWGSRCYLFVDLLKEDRHWLIKKTPTKTPVLSNLQLNTNQLKKMGGNYIISTYIIENTIENNLELSQIFQRDDSPWKIYLYNIT